MTGASPYKGLAPFDDSDRDALWFRCKAHAFDSVVECVIKYVGSKRYSGPGANGREDTGPTIMLVHHARLIVHAREDKI